MNKKPKSDLPLTATLNAACLLVRASSLSGFTVEELTNAGHLLRGETADVELIEAAKDLLKKGVIIDTMKILNTLLENRKN